MLGYSIYGIVSPILPNLKTLTGTIRELDRLPRTSLIPPSRLLVLLVSPGLRALQLQTSTALWQLSRILARSPLPSTVCLAHLLLAPSGIVRYSPPSTS